MPKIQNPKQLDAAMEKRGIESGSADQLAFETGWLRYEQGRSPNIPWEYAESQVAYFHAGYCTAVDALGSSPTLKKPEATGQRPTVHPFARFELAKAALGGITSALHKGIRPTDLGSLAADTVAIADAVLAAMDEKQKSGA